VVAAYTYTALPWSVGGATNATLLRTLRRKPSVLTPSTTAWSMSAARLNNTYWAEWSVFPVNTVSDLRLHTAYVGAACPSVVTSLVRELSCGSLGSELNSGQANNAILQVNCPSNCVSAAWSLADSGTAVSGSANGPYRTTSYVCLAAVIAVRASHRVRFK
jgi:hypothetical protein